MIKELEPKQKRFVEEYIVDLNATQAAIRAGYKADNANVTGPTLKNKPHVSAAIDAALKGRQSARASTCSSCTFFNRKNYECRVGRPSINKSGRGQWPIVSGDDWCGEGDWEPAA